MNCRRGLHLLLTVLLMATAPPVAAQVQIGPQVSAGSDSGLGLGGRIAFPPRTTIMGLDGAIDGNYFFGGGSAVAS